MDREELKKEIYRLIDPNQYCTSTDADKVIDEIERHIKKESKEQFQEHMKKLGVYAFDVHHDNYYGKDYLDELVTGRAYLERFKERAYSLRVYDDYTDEPFVNVLIHGKTIVGKGSKHYRYLIEGLIDEFETNRVKYPVEL